MIALKKLTSLEEYKQLALELGKDTKRKRTNFYNQEVRELNYIIDHIEPQLEKNPFAWHLGSQLTFRDLRNFKKERDLILNNFEELTN